MTHAMRILEAGGPEVLSWQDIDVGRPEPGEVRIKHAAVGLNYIDVYHRTGYYPQELPFIPGLEGAGTVEEIGTEVTEGAVGDRVAYAGSFRALIAGCCICDERLLCRASWKTTCVRTHAPAHLLLA